MYDAARQAAIEQFDIEFLRFTNEQIYDEMEAVLETIAAKIEERRALKLKRRRPHRGLGG